MQFADIFSRQNTDEPQLMIFIDDILKLPLKLSKIESQTIFDGVALMITMTQSGL